MANLSLSQLRDAQKANPPLVNADGEPFVVPVIYQRPSPGAAGPTTAASLPLQASAPVPAVPGGGYCRIFPPTFPSIGAIPQVWKDEFWAGPSPWCHVEGAQQHPDFESNLLLVEAETTPE